MSRQCVGCGTTNSDDASYCEECGEQMQPEVSVSPSDQKDRIGRPESALQARSRDPNAHLRWFKRGLQLLESGLPLDALKSFDLALNLNPNDPDLWALKGRTLSEMDRDDEALVCLCKCLELDPANGYAWKEKGRVLGTQHPDALVCFDRALAIRPNDGDAWFCKGLILARSGVQIQALACFDHSIQFRPDFSDAWFWKAKSLCTLRQFDEALGCCQNGLALAPESEMGWTEKGSAFVGLERYTEAISCFQRVLQLNPEHSDAWFCKGFCLESIGQPEEALHCFEQSLRIDPRNPEIWRCKGRVLLALGREDEARECMSRVVGKQDGVISDSENLKSDAGAEARLDQITKMIQTDPEHALRLTQEIEGKLGPANRRDVAFVHFTYSMIYGQLALNAQSQITGEQPHPDAVAHGERAVEEFRKASELSEFEAPETYEETVITRPAGLFRKAETETRTLTRTVKKRRLGLDNFPSSLDPVAGLLEKATPGYIWGVLGRVKVRHLFNAKHFSISRGVDIDDFNQADLRSLHETWLQSAKPIRAAAWVVGRKHPDPLVAIGLSEDLRIENFTESVVLVKRGESWVRA
jgi:tetratricopeptide (TPR) repeat protein